MKQKPDEGSEIHKQPVGDDENVDFQSTDDEQKAEWRARKRLISRFGGITAQDPVAASRALDCVAAGSARTDVSVCKVASIGHPNANGARAYYDAIKSLL